MSSTKNVSIDLLIQAIRSIKKQKQRPNPERIGHFISKHLQSNISTEKTLELLEESVSNGLLIKRTKNDADTYAIPTENNHSTPSENSSTQEFTRDKGRSKSSHSSSKSEDILDKLFCVSVEQVVSAVAELGSAKRHEIENLIKKSTISKGRNNDLNPEILSQYSCLIKNLLDEALNNGDLIRDSGRRYVLKPHLSQPETVDIQDETAAPVTKLKSSRPNSPKSRQLKGSTSAKRRPSNSSANSPVRQTSRLNSSNNTTGATMNVDVFATDDASSGDISKKRRHSASSPDPSIPRKKKKMAKPIPVCSFCLGDEHMNKRTGEPEDMVACGDCGRCGHPKCLKWPEALYAKVRTLRWQCLQCKQCSYCGRSSHVEEDLLLCDTCDRGFHMACCDPPLLKAPKGRWMCNLCDPPKGRPVRKPIYEDELFTPEELENLNLKELTLMQVQKQAASLQDGLSRFFTPTNRRQSRVSQQVAENAVHGLLSDTSVVMTPPPIISATVVSAQHVRPEEIKRQLKMKEKEDKRVEREASLRQKREKTEERRVQLHQEKLERQKKRESMKKASAGMKAARKLLKKLQKKRQTKTNADQSGRSSSRKKSIASNNSSATKSTEKKRRGRPRKINLSDDDESESVKNVQNDFDTYEDETLKISQKDRDLFQEIQKELHSSLPPAASQSPNCPQTPNGSIQAPQLNLDSIDCAPNSINNSIRLDSPNSVFKAEDVRFPSKIQLGKYIIHTWYSSPYPSEYAKLNVLYICEYCLKYIKSLTVYIRHMEKCTTHFPPGNEIYRDGNLSVWEVDGYSAKLYCQSLCLLAKLFLDHKTLYYDVEPFLFYVLTVCDESSCHLIGYFSKEKHSSHKYNLSCIMVLPQYQKHNYGRFLIEFSYLLSRIEREPGSPEKPLSELGRLSYESFWMSKVVPYVEQLLHSEKASGSSNSHHCHANLVIADISKETGIDAHDIAATLQQLCTIKVSKEGKLVLVFDKEKLANLVEKYQRRSSSWVILKPESLRWSPLVQNSHSHVTSPLISPVTTNSPNKRLTNLSSCVSTGPSSRSRTRGSRTTNQKSSPNKVTQHCRPRKSPTNKRRTDSSSEDESSARRAPSSRTGFTLRQSRGRSSRAASSSAPASTGRSGGGASGHNRDADCLLHRSYSNYFKEKNYFTTIPVTDYSSISNHPSNNILKKSSTDLTCLTVDVEDDETIAMDEENGDYDSASTPSQHGPNLFNTRIGSLNNFLPEESCSSSDNESIDDDQNDAANKDRQKLPTEDELYVKKISLQIEAKESLMMESCSIDALDEFSDFSPISCDNQAPDIDEASTIPELSCCIRDDASNMNETDDGSLGAPEISKMTELELSPKSDLSNGGDESAPLNRNQNFSYPHLQEESLLEESLSHESEETISQSIFTKANLISKINEELENDKDAEENDSHDLSVLDFPEVVSSEEPIPSLQDKFINCSEEVTDSSCIQLLCLSHLEEKGETPPPDLEERPSSSDLLEDPNASRQMPDIVNESDNFKSYHEVMKSSLPDDYSHSKLPAATYMTVSIPQNSPTESSGSTQNRTPSVNADFSPPYRMPLINKEECLENNLPPPSSPQSNASVNLEKNASTDALDKLSPVEELQNSFFDNSLSTNDSILKCISSSQNSPLQENLDAATPTSINPSSSSFDNNTSLDETLNSHSLNCENQDELCPPLILSDKHLNENQSMSKIVDKEPPQSPRYLKSSLNHSETNNGLSESYTDCTRLTNCVYSSANDLFNKTTGAFSLSTNTSQKSTFTPCNYQDSRCNIRTSEDQSYLRSSSFSNSNLQCQSTFDSHNVINSPISVISQTANILHSSDEMISYDCKLSYTNDSSNTNQYSEYNSKHLNFMSDLCANRSDSVYDTSPVLSCYQIVSSSASNVSNNLHRALNVTHSPNAGMGPVTHFSQPSTPTAAFPNTPQTPHQPSPPNPTPRAVPPKYNQAPTPPSPKQISIPSPYKLQQNPTYYHNMQNSKLPNNTIPANLGVGRQLSAPSNLLSTKLQSFCSEASVTPQPPKKSKNSQSNKKNQPPSNYPPNSIPSAVHYMQKAPSVSIHPGKNIIPNYYYPQAYLDPTSSKHITPNLSYPQQLSPYLCPPSVQPYTQSLYNEYCPQQAESHFMPYQHSSYNTQKTGYNFMAQAAFDPANHANNFPVKPTAWPPAPGMYPYGNVGGVSMASFAVAAAQRNRYPTTAYSYPHSQHSHLMPQ